MASPFWDPFSLLLPHLPLQIHSPSSLPPGRLTPALPRNLDLWFCLGNLWPMGGPRGRAEDGQRLLRPGFEYFLHPWGSRCSSSRFSWAWQWKDSFVYSPTSVWLWPDWASLELSPSVESCGCGLALGRAVGLGVVTRRVLAAPVVCAAAAEGRVAQHEGALPPPCIVRKDPRVPHTARRGA